MQKFTPYCPPYSSKEKVERSAVVFSASFKAATRSIDPKAKIAASVEITDRCNAGCHYCYVYPQEWNQHQRMQGYLQLSSPEQLSQEKKVFQTLEVLKKEGIVHITLVGGETALAPKAIKKAAELFPIVWIVTNGTIPLPSLPRSVTTFVSIDGPPDYHNRTRDPLGFFAGCRYRDLEGMSARIVQNINKSFRGAFVHCTLTPPIIAQLPETVDWLVRDVAKLRGIVVSGATATSSKDSMAFTIADRELLKNIIAEVAQKYSWDLFPFNQPKVNEYLFDKKNIITSPSECSVSKRVVSLDYKGESTGKCVLRDEAACETCVCNMTGLQRAIESFDVSTLKGNLRALFG